MRKTYTLSEEQNPKRYISWGLGVQSTALCLMSCFGDYSIPKMDAIITADTGWELPATNQFMNYYTKIFEKSGIPVYVVSSGDIHNEQYSNDVINIPLWSKGGGPIVRQCTSEYKIAPIRRKIRELLNMNPKGYGRTKLNSVLMYLGISYDESQRMKDSDVIYIKNMYPLVDLKISRDMCKDYYKEKSLPIPPKSSCICCPFQMKSRYKLIKDEYPKEWVDLIEFDERIRKPTDGMTKRNFKSDLFVSKYKEPIKDINFASIDADDENLDICDSGYCFV